MSENNHFPTSRIPLLKNPSLFLWRLKRFIWPMIAGALLFWAYHRLAGLGMNYEWQWNRAWRQLIIHTSSGIKAGPLLDGIFLTIAITLSGAAIATILGCILAWMRLCDWPAWRVFATLFINLFRNTPLLLQLFFIYFLIAPVLKVGPFAAALIALGAFEGAYMAEIFRGALLSVNKNQWEASLSLGFNVRQSLFSVILPQAFHNALPAYANQCVSILKDSTLVSAIALADLTMRAQAIVAETFLAFEIWLLVGALYLFMAAIISLPALWLRKKSIWR